MAHPIHHAESSARRFGGEPEDYAAIHDWFDASKEHLAIFTHRALRHHAQGIFEAERTFGRSIVNSAGREVPVRFIGEQHVKEDCGGRVPSLGDWLTRIQPAPWMGSGSMMGAEEDIGADPSQAWREAVARGRTILGFAEWIDANGEAA